MTLIDVTILAAFVAYAVAAGWRSRRIASQSLEEYFLAGRSLRGWKAGVSMAATQFAADTPLLVTGLIATAGVFSLWRLWIYGVAFLLLGFVLSGAWRRAGVLTDAELTELRYSARPAAILRGAKAVYFGIVFNCTVLAMVLFAATVITEEFLVWHRWLPENVFAPLVELVKAAGVPFATQGSGDELWIHTADNALSIAAILAVTTLYSATGGLRSVVATDLVQFAIMMIATTAYAVWVLTKAGGLGQLPENLERLAAGGSGGLGFSELVAFTPSRAKDAGLALLSVYALQWLVQMNADGTGYLAQRTMACRSDRDAKVAALVFAGLQIFARSLLWILLGLGLLLLLPPDPGLSGEALRLDRERTFVLGIKQLPPGLLGLMLTAMLAALASTVDTHLNWGASYFANDIYKRFVCEAWLKRTPSPRALVWVARGANLLILAIAVLIVSQLSSIQTAWQISLLFGAGMGVLLVLRWLWWRITAWGEIASLVVSSILAPVTLLTIDGEALRLLVMAAGATAAGVGVSLLGGAEPRARLQAFFERARPPGFWSVLAHPEASIAPRRLGRGLLATALGALSLFSLLTGTGSWLIGSPPPTWFPFRAAWVTLLLLLGLGLVPVWWRLGFRPHGQGRHAEKVPGT